MRSDVAPMQTEQYFKIYAFIEFARFGSIENHVAIRSKRKSHNGENYNSNVPVFTLNSRSFAACLNFVVSGLDAQLWPFFHLLDFCFSGLYSCDGPDLPTLIFPITADKM